MTETPILTTERLILRPLTQADAPDLSRIGGHSDVAPMLMAVTMPWPEAAVRVWIGTQPEGDPSHQRFGICLKKNGTLIGTIRYGGSPEPSVGYFIDANLHGQGYASEALCAVLEFARVRFDPPIIVADHFADNPASGRVLEKLGFERVGQGMGESAARATTAPIHIYQLTTRKENP